MGFPGGPRCWRSCFDPAQNETMREDKTASTCVQCMSFHFFRPPTVINQTVPLHRRNLLRPPMEFTGTEPNPKNHSNPFLRCILHIDSLLLFARPLRRRSESARPVVSSTYGRSMVDRREVPRSWMDSGLEHLVNIFRPN